MANAPSSLKPTGPTTKMMPEGSQGVCTPSSSRQIDQIIKDEWTTLKVLPGSGLPKSTHQPGEATKTSSGKDASFTGQVLFGDSKAIYQLSGKGMVGHLHSVFAELGTRGEKIVDGRGYTVAYANGKGVTSDAQTANVTRPRTTSKSHGAPM